MAPWILLSYPIIGCGPTSCRTHQPSCKSPAMPTLIGGGVAAGPTGRPSGPAMALEVMLTGRRTGSLPADWMSKGLSTVEAGHCPFPCRLLSVMNWQGFVSDELAVMTR